MSGIDDLIPSATQIRKEAALKEAKKAVERSPCDRLEGFALVRGARRQQMIHASRRCHRRRVVNDLNLEYPNVSPE